MSNTLQEFLVKINFSETGGQTALNNIKNVTKSLMGSAVALVAVGYKTKQFETNLAKGLHSLYLNSKMAGASSIANFKAMQNAAEKVGISSDSMVSSLMGVQSFLLNTGSGGLSYLKTLASNIKETDDSTTIQLKLAKEIQAKKAQLGDTLDTRMMLKHQYTAGGIMDDATFMGAYNGKAGEMQDSFNVNKKAAAGNDKALASAEALNNKNNTYETAFDAGMLEANITGMKVATDALDVAMDKIPDTVKLVSDAELALEEASKAAWDSLQPLIKLLEEFAIKNPVEAVGITIAAMALLPSILGAGLKLIFTGVTAGTTGVLTAIGTAARFTIAGLTIGAAGYVGTKIGKAVYDNESTDKQQRDQNIMGNIMAFLGNDEAIAAKKQLEDFNKASATGNANDLAKIDGSSKATQTQTELDKLIEDAKNLTNKTAEDTTEKVKNESKAKNKILDEDTKESSKTFTGWISSVFDTFKDKALDTLKAIGGFVVNTSNASETPYRGENASKLPDFTGNMKGNEKASYAMSKLMEMGWSKEQAAGVAANLHRESGFKTDIVGDGGKAYGIGQWHPDRQANFAKKFGHSIKGSTLDEQLKFVDYELKSTEQGAGNKLKGARSAREAGGIVSKYYERPRDRESEAVGRGGHAEQLANNFKGNEQAYLNTVNAAKNIGDTQPVINNTTNVNVTGTHTNEQTGKVVAEHVNAVQQQVAKKYRTGAI